MLDSELRSVIGKQAPSPNGNWGLQIGIHQGTFTSRDSEPPQWDFTSLLACKNAFAKERNFYRSISCSIWLAYAIAPDGTIYNLVHEE